MSMTNAQRCKKWREANPGKSAAACRKWREKSNYSAALVCKKWREVNPGKNNLVCRNWRAANREKASAHNAFHWAVAQGRIKKQPCVVCGNEKAEGHHFDYSKPLEVIWLCHRHHKQQHRQH